jgi:ribose-phosphate pyrophosphokinase
MLGATHAVLADPAYERIQKSPIKELVVTNTIPIPKDKMIDKIKVVSIAPLFAEAIRRLNTSEPLGDLFEYEK